MPEAVRATYLFTSGGSRCDLLAIDRPAIPAMLPPTRSQACLRLCAGADASAGSRGAASCASNIEPELRAAFKLSFLGRPDLSLGCCSRAKC